jgi:predicted metalloprotease
MRCESNRESDNVEGRLLLFRGATPTACGTGQTAMGRFYCPGDFAKACVFGQELIGG